MLSFFSKASKAILTQHNQQRIVGAIGYAGLVMGIYSPILNAPLHNKNIEKFKESERYMPPGP